MRINNANFDAQNALQDRKPRFVIEIDFSDNETDLNYFTSHDDIPTVTPVTHGVLKNTSSISQKLMPERANSSIGTLSFDLLDANKAVTTLFNTKRVNRQVLFGKRARLYIGYEGLAWADYRLEQTQFIDKKIKYKNGIYKMSCKDSQDPMNKPILEPLETRLSVALSDTDTNVQVYNTTDFALVARDSDHLDAPNTDCTYIEISDNGKKEYCRVTAIGSTNFTVVRGVLGSTAQVWTLPNDASDEKGAKVKELIFVQMKSLKLAYAILTGNLLNQVGTLPPHWHVGMDASIFNSAEFDNQDDFTAYSLELKKTDCKKFIESEILLPNSRYFRVNGAGGLDLKRLFAINSESSPVFQLDETNITKYSDLEYDANVTSNKFSIDWSYDPFPKKAEFRRKSTFVFADSVTDYGEKLKASKFRLINGANATTTTLINLVNSYADRYAGEGARLKLSTFSKHNDLEVGDVCLVKHSGIQDFNSGASISRAMQIISTKVDQQKGTVDLDLFGSTFAPEPLTDGVVAVMNNGFYTATGTQISNIATGQLTANTTLTGSDNHNNSVFYHDGDLTINAGVTLTITDNVQIRIRGHLTVLGDIDAVGNGRDSGGGFIGSSIGRTGNYCRPSNNASGQVCDLRYGTWTTGQYEACPSFDLDNPDGNSFSGVPSDLRGSFGGKGGTSTKIDALGEISELSQGGAGNASGSACVIICRGMSLSGAGAVDVSGVQGNAAVADGLTVGGFGGFSTPGAFVVLLDGGTSSVPNLSSRITALGHDPDTINGLDIKQNASRIQFLPQARTPVGDDPIDDSSTTLYTWIKFADDANGTGLTDDPTGKAYLGLAYNKTVQTEGTDPTAYTWSKVLGDNGADGSDGSDGTTTYTWVKYADDASGGGLTDDPTNKTYIGLAFNKTTATESTVAGDYTWSLYIGSDGVDGLDGADGYSNILDPSQWVIGGVGTQSDFIRNGSDDENTIVLDVGAFGFSEPLWECKTNNAGNSNSDGGWNNAPLAENYDTSKTHRYTVLAKQTSSNGTVYLGCAAAFNISLTANNNPYFWNGDLPELDKWFLIVGYLHGSSYTGATSGKSGVYSLETGQQVIVGNDFICNAANTQRHRAYWFYSTDTAARCYFSRPRLDEVNGNEPSLSDLMGRLATNGLDGSDGIAGLDGADGQTYYTWIKFADDASGTGLTDDPTGKAYLGLSTNQTVQAEGTDPAAYTWSKITGNDGSDGADGLNGADGTDGIPGNDGADGQTTYTWVKYADDASGTGLSNTSAGKTYIGFAFNKTTATESTVAGDYAWTKFVGDNGTDGTGANPILSDTTDPITGVTHVSVGNLARIEWSFKRKRTGSTFPGEPAGTTVTLELRRDGVAIESITAGVTKFSEPAPDDNLNFWTYNSGVQNIAETNVAGSYTYTVVEVGGGSGGTVTGYISIREEQ